MSFEFKIQVDVSKRFEKINKSDYDTKNGGCHLKNERVSRIRSIH